MATYDKEIGALVAMAKVVGTNASAITNRGFETIERVSPGVYTLTREEGYPGAELSADEVISQVTPNTNVPRFASSQELEDTSTTVTIFDAAGAPADSDFTITVHRTTNHE